MTGAREDSLKPIYQWMCPDPSIVGTDTPLEKRAIDYWKRVLCPLLWHTLRCLWSQLLRPPNPLHSTLVAFFKIKAGGFQDWSCQ